MLFLDLDLYSLEQSEYFGSPALGLIDELCAVYNLAAMYCIMPTK